MKTRRMLLNGLNRTLEGAGFDARFVAGSVIDTGAQADRARAIADRLNAVRPGLDKQPVVLWSLPGQSAVTVRGRFIYVSKILAERLGDDALAFVLAHEMAHHDLGHVANPLGTLVALGFGSDAEHHADEKALEIVMAAGFDPSGGLQALGPEVWGEEAEVEAEHPPRGPRRWLRRWTQSHPPTPERLAAIERWIAEHS